LADAQTTPNPKYNIMSEWPESIIHAVSATALTTPDRNCFLYEGRWTTYGDLLKQAGHFAAGLHAWGLKHGDRVALFLENSPEFLFAYLGTGLAGGIVVLVNTQYKQVELRHILSDASVSICVTGEMQRAELARVEAELPDLKAVILTTGEASRPNDISYQAFQQDTAVDQQLPKTDDVAVIGYTSGTTGRSKGAMLTHKNLAANAWAVTTAWQWTVIDHLLLTLPLFHVHGLTVGTHGTLLCGATMELCKHFDVKYVFDALMGKSEKSPTMFFGVPTMYARLLAESASRGERPAPIRLYVSGSAPLSVHVHEDFTKVFGQPILERYGMTETLMNTTNPYGGKLKAGTVGVPFPGQEARIVDVQSREPLPDGETGEIEVRGPNVFEGYWNRTDATDAAFDRDGWFKTGDLGLRDADGYFIINGRAHELIISGGYNIYPREVEEVLLTHSGVAEVAVVGMPNAEFGEEVVAVVVAKDKSAMPNADDLVQLCKANLASYKKPKHIFFTDSLPRNAMSKVQKHLIKDWLNEQGGKAKPSK
jgi:malonyl-CoA/methylmalonyl-CoA synthetase